MNGKSIKVGGQTVSGAVTIRSTVSKEKAGEPILVRLNKGVSYAHFFKVLKTASGDPNVVQLVGAIAFDADAAPGTSNVQTLLEPDRYVALDKTGKTPRVAEFTVTKSPSPAKLPKAAVTATAIEFGFRGPTTFKDGTMVRGYNDGWLVHMNDFQSVKNAKTGKKVIALLRQGKTKKAFGLTGHGSFSLFEPVSHGATQQMILKTKPGYYVEACLMTTEDGRYHTQLGMERLIKVVK